MSSNAVLGNFPIVGGPLKNRTIPASRYFSLVVLVERPRIGPG